MASILIITPVEKLQKEINAIVKTLNKMPGIYVSLNKTHESIKNILKSNKISIDRLFFIDCVTSEQKRNDVLHISPRELDKLSLAISTFIKDIPGKKFLIIDALSTLLIYNDENKVARFIKETIEYASEKDVEVIAISPKTKGEELLDKIFNFFDKVKGKK